MGLYIVADFFFEFANDEYGYFHVVQLFLTLQWQKVLLCYSFVLGNGDQNMTTTSDIKNSSSRTLSTTSKRESS